MKERMTAKLEIIMGNMFSGKTSELIRRLKRHKVIGHEVLVINSEKDSRNKGSVLQTHDRETFECLKICNLLDVVESEEYKSARVVAIDEAQFFKNLHEFVKVALKDKKHVILAGLDGDYKQETFGELLTLIPLADEVTKLTAMCMDCMDGTAGPFTKRRTISTCASIQELIGGGEIYKAVCRNHL
jgi:thymidine kinase